MISKKDLLIKMNISYGQLYRWKREGLIPDSWFIKQSVSTGQETFFDEKLIIPRIEQIKSLKDKYQFDEMRNIFNDSESKEFHFKEALSVDSIDPYFLKIYLKNRTNITITELSILYLLTKYDNELNSIELLNYDFSKISKEDTFFFLLKNKDSYSFMIAKKPIHIYGKTIIYKEECILDVVNLLAKKI